jgi:glycosyltransferase involved in cell wall biosynthesis
VLTRTDGRQLVGHFGTYGDHVAPLLRAQLGRLLAIEPSLVAVCIGAGSDRFVQDMLALQPGLQPRLVGTGRLAPEAVSLHVRACDLLIQPYTDGVTTRRTSVMASLVNGRPVVTTDGELTEPVWHRTGAVALVPADQPERVVHAARLLLANPSARAELASRGEATYRSTFAVEHTIARLRDRPAGAAA